VNWYRKIRVITHCWVQYKILSDEYTAVKPILDEAFAAVYETDKIIIAINDVYWTVYYTFFSFKLSEIHIIIHDIFKSSTANMCTKEIIKRTFDINFKKLPPPHNFSFDIRTTVIFLIGNRSLEYWTSMFIHQIYRNGQGIVLAEHGKNPIQFYRWTNFKPKKDFTTCYNSSFIKNLCV
jgi:hypothetical protein